MSVGFPEWMGIYILIYSQTRNVQVIFKDGFGKTDINKVNPRVKCLAHFEYHFNLTV